MVMLAGPGLARLRVWELRSPVTTFPKPTLAGVGVSCESGALTVRVAALLVALPAELLTTTVN
jgi:hypothetical protein